ncbi:MAG: YbaB/EbfC family nucleoid-associated protein [Chloroflexota bacterium]
MNRDLMRQAQQLQAKLLKAQQELEQATVDGTSGGGAVTVVITGNQKVRSVKISPEVVDPEDVDMLEDLVMTAMNEALEKSQDLAKQRMGSLAGGFNIPGLM